MWVPFGATGIEVTRLCAGTGTSGFGGSSVQARRPPEEYANVLLHAYERGIRFWDTSDDYGTHAHVCEALRRVPRSEVVLASKIHSASPAEARAAVARCLEELAVERIDVLLMHEVDSPEDLARRRPALGELHRMREEGLIRAVGLSTHNIDTLELAAEDPEVQVLFTNYNLANLHMDADRRDYERALERAHGAGQAVYVHKTLAEGRLADRAAEAIAHNLTRPFVHSVCVGVTSAAEVDAAADVLNSLEEALR